MNNSGRTTDASFWKSLYGVVDCRWDDYYGNGSGSGSGYGDVGWGSSKSKRRHEFSPVLLVFTTVYNCKHCGAKKEDCLTDYCPDKKDDFDIGDWG